MVANRRVTGGDAGDGSEQTPHVVIGYVDARAGPDSPRHRSGILAPGLVAVTVNLFAGEPEQPDQVGIRAEAAVPLLRSRTRLPAAPPPARVDISAARTRHPSGPRRRVGCDQADRPWPSRWRSTRRDGCRSLSIGTAQWRQLRPAWCRRHAGHCRRRRGRSRLRCCNPGRERSAYHAGADMSAQCGFRRSISQSRLDRARVAPSGQTFAVARLAGLEGLPGRPEFRVEHAPFPRLALLGAGLPALLVRTFGPFSAGASA